MSCFLEGQTILDLPLPPTTAEGYTSWVYGLEQVRVFFWSCLSGDLETSLTLTGELVCVRCTIAGFPSALRFNALREAANSVRPIGSETGVTVSSSEARFGLALAVELLCFDILLI